MVDFAKAKKKRKGVPATVAVTVEVTPPKLGMLTCSVCKKQCLEKHPDSGVLFQAGDLCCWGSAEAPCSGHFELPGKRTQPKAPKPEAKKQEASKPDVKPVQVEMPFVGSGPLPQTTPTRKLPVVLDDMEYDLINTYTKLFNDEHTGVEGFSPVDVPQFLVFSTLRWIEYLERSEVDDAEASAGEDATPEESTTSPAVSAVDPVDDDPEFVEAWAARVSGVPS